MRAYVAWRVLYAHEHTREIRVLCENKKLKICDEPADLPRQIGFFVCA